MSGRRNNARYQLSVPRDGELVITQDIVIESRTDDEICVLTETPQPRGQELTLELGAAVAAEGIEVSVLDCTPVVDGGTLRYRLRFAIRKGLNSPAASV
jgi:hypothetical protein